MSYRQLSRALVLSALLLSLPGCLVEPSPNANTNAGGAVENRAAPTPVASPESQPSPESRPSTESLASPEPSPSPLLSAGAEAGGKLGAYVRASAAGLAPEQREALGHVEGEGRRLLALRGYLRSGGDAGARWAWSRERIESYERSAEYAAALAEIEKVRRAFEAANPGHTLRVNTKVRSLDEQLEKWNEADSVARAGEELLARVRAEVEGGSYGEGAPPADVRRFEGFLRGASTRSTPTLAVPGLSPHGQARAFDFQVMRGSQLIAAPTSPSAWDSAGWTAKLQEAVRASGTKFSGPLASPREPWHYDYQP
ncbi:MAG TPA: hypothetical protein VF588_12270 [Pyrinomonadaceae bacterium]|jgi:hypothetical protein